MSITKEMKKEEMKKTLQSWIDPEEVGYGKILSFDVLQNGDNAFALVSYPETNSVEIDHIWYSHSSNSANLSREHQFFLSEDEKEREAALELIQVTYQTIIRRFK